MSRITDFSKKRRIIVSILSLSLMANVPSVYAASEITGVNNPGSIGHIDGDSVIKGDNGNFIYNVNPTAANGDIGFRQYGKFNLSEGDIANLIFKYGEENVSKFVNFVDNTININGIVNAMRDGNMASDGHLIFVSPNGMVVGASGVLNVGSLSVLSPSTQDYTKFKGNMYEYAPILSKEGTPEYNALMNSNGTGTIHIDGKVLARDLISLRAADISVGPNANIMAGVRDAATLLNSNAQADALFSQLVKTDAMSANSFANDKGTIRITSYGSNGGFSADSSSVITNFGKGDTIIASAGTKGVKLNGKLTNSNGNTSITSDKGGIIVGGTTQNKNGKLDILSKDGGIHVTEKGVLKNTDGETLITSNGSGGITVDNLIQTVNGNTTLKNTGTKGVTVNGLISAKNGDLLIDNSASGGININKSKNEYSIKNENGALTIRNSGSGGTNILGNVYSDAKDSLITNSNGGILVDSSAKVINNSNKLTMENTGSQGIRIKGLVNAHGIDITNKNSNVVIGDETSNNKYLTSKGDINININRGNLLNSGVAKTHLVTENGGNLKIDVVDGSIGEAVKDGIGPDARDLTKSINANIDGTYTARTKMDSMTGDSVINMAAIDSDMKLNTVNADGKVYLLADSSVKGQKQYSIVNASKNPDTVNVTGKGISLIASGNIGDSKNALTFTQTEGTFNDSSLDMDKLTYKPSSKYTVDMLSKDGDIIIKSIDKNYDTNVGAIVARNGNVNAEFAGDAYIHEITGAKEIRLVGSGKNMYIEHLGQVPTYQETGDYYGPYNKSVTPEKAYISVLDLGTIENPNNQADSLLIIKNGTINGKNEGRPESQDLTI